MLLGDEALARAGLRIIAPDRPGIGMSDFKPGRGFSDWPKDVAGLADSLGLQRSALLGNSGDGAYVAACAAAIPKRVTAVVIVSGAWRMDAPEVAANLPFVNRMFWILARRFSPGLRVLLNTMRGPGKSSRDTELAKMRAHLAPIDFATLSEPGRLEAVQLSIHECLRAGTKGAAWDIGLYVRPFDFSVASIRIPLHVFHGTEDRNVPLALVRSVVRHIPTATLTEFVNDAHLSSLCHHLDELALALNAGQPLNASSDSSDGPLGPVPAIGARVHN
jgi:pimeloyl-ACP methyl ester carboxylesterase